MMTLQDFEKEDGRGYFLKEVEKRGSYNEEIMEKLDHKYLNDVSHTFTLNNLI